MMHMLTSLTRSHSISSCHPELAVRLCGVKCSPWIIHFGWSWFCSWKCIWCKWRTYLRLWIGLTASQLAICWSRRPSQLFTLYFWLHCLFYVSQGRHTGSHGNHFIAGHFPNDKGWRWNDESWNDMISLGELGAPRWKTGSLCSAAVSVLPEPWNNDPSLFISVYSVNHNTSEMSLAFRRRTIDLVCALPHQQAVTGLHPNWGN